MASFPLQEFGVLLDTEQDGSVGGEERRRQTQCLARGRALHEERKMTDSGLVTTLTCGSKVANFTDSGSSAPAANWRCKRFLIIDLLGDR
jgi:hypothetical protein